MKNDLKFGLIVACCLILASIPGVAAQNFDNIDQNLVYKIVPQNGTIYFGEEHLNISACMADKTGRHLPYLVALDFVRNVTDSVLVEDPTDFTMPIDKPENTWYLSEDGDNAFVQDGNFVTALVTQEPVINFEVWNAETDTKIADNGTAYRGNLLRFKYTVDTNLDKLTTRADYDPAKGYISMAVIAPDDEQLLDLMTLDPATLATAKMPVTGLDVSPSPGWIWPKNLNPSGVIGWWTNWRNAEKGLESDYAYKLGFYKVTAVCNVNNMFKNRQMDGYTFKEQSFTLEPRPLTVTVNGLETGRDKQFTATVSGLPATTYQIFIYDECPTKLTGKICDRPPYIVGSREELLRRDIILDPTTGPYPIGNTVVLDCCKEGMKIREIVPSGDAYPSQGSWEIVDNGTRYYAQVTTGPDGTVTIPFWVDTMVNAATYTIQVQDFHYQQKATADVSVSKGSISVATMNPSGEAKSEFFVGDEIWIDGTNTDSNMSYLWITGPGLDPCGVNIYDPFSTDPVRAVVYDNKDGKTSYWRIDPNWITNNSAIGAGNYTLWVASADPNGRFCNCNGDGCTFCSFGSCLGVSCERGVCELTKCPECAVFTQVPITLVQPEVTADISDVTRCCCPGYPCGQLGGAEEIWINGTSGGNNCKELQVWLFGQSQFGTRNYLFTVTPTYCDDTFQFELNKGLFQPNGISLCQMGTGTYDIIVQVPGGNGMFDINLAAPESNQDRYVTSTLPVTGSKVFKIEGKDALTSGVALKSLKDGLNQPGIDDKYVSLSFTLADKKCEGNVDFTVDRNNGNAPLTVQFTDKSILVGTKWAWYANDVLIASEQNPKYTFTVPGKYTIRMEITDENGITSSAVKDGYITVLSSPVADFSYGPQPAGINEAVQFTDQSTGSPTSWMWDFGDTNTSSLQSPTHAFINPGTYEVTLMVSNAFGIGAPIKKPVTIVHDKPVADFKGDPTESAFYPAAVTFTDLSTGFVSAWMWEFSREGKMVATSMDKNPVITFNEPGIYDVNLTISNDGGKQTASKPGYITIGTGSIITLAQGWNHVSVPKKVTPDFDTLGELFNGVQTDGMPYAVYGPDNGMTNWTNVTPDYPVKPLEAFRVYSALPGFIQIRPSYVDGVMFSQSLKEGWNGIGIMAMQPTPANVALMSLGDSWDKVLAYNPVTQWWEYPIIRGVDDDKPMNPTVGYLIQMNKDSVLTGGEV